jgi:hypothetical protein
LAICLRRGATEISVTFFTATDPVKSQIDRSSARDLGADLAELYSAGDPFPHIVIDDFLPEPVLRRCLEEFGSDAGNSGRQYDRDQERLKKEYRPDELSPAVRNLFYTFNSLPFIRVIENISGIKGLIPDPYFRGGGFHEISNGGHLSVHADFNHHVSMNLERRINLLIYLNDGWEDAYGGQLELWANDMSKCVKSIVPVFNRAVMFNTTSFSNHGNPTPVNHPAGQTRKSIALYYYTATWDDTKRSHTTQFRARAGTADKPDWRVRGRELYQDVMPPIIRRSISKLRKQKAESNAGADY